MVKHDPEHRIRISCDDIRKMLGGWRFDREHLVWSMYGSILQNAIDEGYDIVIDNTGLSQWQTNLVKDAIGYDEEFDDDDIYKEIWKNEDYYIEYKTFFDVTLSECIERDKHRENSVGEKVIRNFYKKYPHAVKGE